MRARMYRDDLERVVDEIENSEIMWLGISRGALGYDQINTDGEVTVRSEVARLTRLYDRAVKTNTMNNPDMYMAGAGSDGVQAGLRVKALPSQPGVPVSAPQTVPAASATDASAAPAAPVATAAPIPDPDESPATAAKPKPPPKYTASDAPKDDKKATSGEPSTSPAAGTEGKIESSPNGEATHDESSGSTLNDSSQAGSSTESNAKPTVTSVNKPDGPKESV